MNKLSLKDIDSLTLFFGNEITLKDIRLFYFIDENPYCTTKQIKDYFEFTGTQLSRPLGRLCKGYRNKTVTSGSVKGLPYISSKSHPNFKNKKTWYVNPIVKDRINLTHSLLNRKVAEND